MYKILSNIKKHKKVIGFSIGLLIFLVIIYIGGKKSIEMVVKPLFIPLFFCFIFFTFFFITHSLRWGYITNKIERKKVCPYFTYCFYSATTFFANEYLPRVGGDFLLRPGLLNKMDGVLFKRGFMTVFFEKILDFLLMIIFIIPSVLYILKILPFQYALLIILLELFVLFFFFLFKNHVFIKILKKVILVFLLFLKKVPFLNKRIKESYFLKLENIHGVDVLGKKALFTLLAITILRYSFLVGRIYFLSLALGLNIPLSVLFLGIPIAQFSLLLAPTPGALGVLEGGWYFVLALSGISQANIATFLVGQRVYWFIFTSIIFLSVYLIFGITGAKKDIKT